MTFDPLPALSTVTCPVLGVFGEQDTITPAPRAAENMRRVLTQVRHPDFTIRVFPNAGHSLSLLPAKAEMAPRASRPSGPGSSIGSARPRCAPAMEKALVNLRKRLFLSRLGGDLVGIRS